MPREATMSRINWAIRCRIAGPVGRQLPEARRVEVEQFDVYPYLEFVRVRLGVDPLGEVREGSGRLQGSADAEDLRVGHPVEIGHLTSPSLWWNGDNSTPSGR